MFLSGDPGRLAGLSALFSDFLRGFSRFLSGKFWFAYWQFRFPEWKIGFPQVEKMNHAALTTHRPEGFGRHDVWFLIRTLRDGKKHERNDRPEGCWYATSGKMP